MGSDTSQIVRVRDVMHKRLITIDGMATARDAAAKMRINRARQEFRSKYREA